MEKRVELQRKIDQLLAAPPSAGKTVPYVTPGAYDTLKLGELPHPALRQRDYVVRVDGDVKRRKTVYEHFHLIYKLTGLVVPKPFSDMRHTIAEFNSERIAEKRHYKKYQ